MHVFLNINACAINMPQMLTLRRVWIFTEYSWGWLCQSMNCKVTSSWVWSHHPEGSATWQISSGLTEGRPRRPSRRPSLPAPLWSSGHPPCLHLLVGGFWAIGPRWAWGADLGCGCRGLGTLTHSVASQPSELRLPTQIPSVSDESECWRDYLL